MKVKLVKKIKKNTPLEKEVDRNESKMCHARHTDFDFAVCAYEEYHMGGYISTCLNQDVFGWCNCDGCLKGRDDHE